MVPVSPREVLFSVRVSLCAQEGVGGLCLAFLGSSSSPHMEQQRCEVWVERSGWRHKEEGKGGNERALTSEMPDSSTLRKRDCL